MRTVSVRAVVVVIYSAAVVIYSGLGDALPLCKRGVEHTVFVQAVDATTGYCTAVTLVALTRVHANGG